MSRPQAVLLDFYGTVVEEDDQQIRQICVEISDTSSEQIDPHTIGSYWSDLFSHLCTVSVGPSFATQRALERQSLRETIRRFGSVADEETLSKQMFAYWRQPTLFQEATAFLSEIAQPVCIVSDIDRTDIEAAISHHGIGVDRIVTSEDAMPARTSPGRSPSGSRSTDWVYNPIKFFILGTP